MAPVVTQVQGLDLFEDAFAQARQQGLAEHQRQHGGGVLQEAAGQGDGQQCPQPLPGQGGVEAAIGQVGDGAAGASIVDCVADQPLLPGQGQVAGDIEGGDQGEAPGHLAVDGQGAQEGVS